MPKQKQSKKNKHTKSVPKKSNKKEQVKSVTVKQKKAASSPRRSDYKFKNYFTSETQLKKIDYNSDPEDILEAYSRLITVYASKHLREGVELEDLVTEAQMGVCEAIEQFQDVSYRRKKSYNFHQACMYKIRSYIYQYCLRNITQLKTPYYIQRGCMHIGQIFKLMSNQAVAEEVLKRRGPAAEEEIIEFIYNEKERLPLKSMRFIKSQITKDKKSPEFKQILSGVMNHELGSRHSYVKNNLTDVGKILHIKNKLYYAATSNNMNYARVIDLILSARHSKIELTPQLQTQAIDDIEEIAQRNELIKRGRELCGELQFDIFMDNKLLDKSYEEISNTRNIKKTIILDIIKRCIKILQKDPIFLESFQSIN